MTCIECGVEFVQTRTTHLVCTKVCRLKARSKQYTYRYRAKRPEKHREANARHRQSHLAEVQEYQRRYGAEHSAKIVERTRQWRLAHPEEYRERSRQAAQSRRARLRGVVNDLTPEQWEAVCIEFGDRCVYCGAPNEEMDHDVPVSRGGGHTRSNVVPSCRRCNVRKHTHTGFEWVLLSWQ